MADDRRSLIDWLGPGPVVSIILTVGSAVVVGALSVYHLVGAHALAIAQLTERAGDHESRLRAQEQRPPRLSSVADDLRECCDGCNNAIAACKERAAVMDERVRHIEAEQGRDRLCARVAQCNSGPRR